LLGDPPLPLLVLGSNPLLNYGFGHTTTMQPFRSLGKRGSSDAYDNPLIMGPVG
jgi:hypothetical protein